MASAGTNMAIAFWLLQRKRRRAARVFAAA
jgi:hypothetical protein